MKPEVLYHYTIGDRIREIVDSGILRRAAAFLPPKVRPVVWFTQNPNWDSTANKLFKRFDGAVARLTTQETSQLGGGLFRIVIAPENAPYGWNDYKQMSNDAPSLVRNLERTAKMAGANPKWDWYVSFEDIPRASWLAVERFDEASRKWSAIELPATPQAPGVESSGTIPTAALLNRPDEGGQ